MNIEEIKEEHTFFIKKVQELVREFNTKTGCFVTCHVDVTTNRIREGSDTKYIKRQSFFNQLKNPFED